MEVNTAVDVKPIVIQPQQAMDDPIYEFTEILVSQSGTAIPTHITKGGNSNITITWTRSGVGRYVGTLNKVTEEDKTSIYMGNQGNGITLAGWNDTSEIYVNTNDMAGAAADQLLYKTPMLLKLWKD